MCPRCVRVSFVPSCAPPRPGAPQLWAQLAEAVGSGGNYRRYRELLGGAGGAGGFRVPALGIHLRDLVSLEAALPDWGGPGRPHPNKLRARFALQGALLAGREQGPPGTPHPDLLRLLEVRPPLHRPKPCPDPPKTPPGTLKPLLGPPKTAHDSPKLLLRPPKPLLGPPNSFLGPPKPPPGTPHPDLLWLWR